MVFATELTAQTIETRSQGLVGMRVLQTSEGVSGEGLWMKDRGGICMPTKYEQHDNEGACHRHFAATNLLGRNAGTGSHTSTFEVCHGAEKLEN